MANRRPTTEDVITNINNIDDDLDDDDDDGSHPDDFYHGRAFRIYCQNMRRYPLLTKDEEITIALAMATEKMLIAEIETDMAKEKTLIAECKTKKAKENARRRYKNARRRYKNARRRYKNARDAMVVGNLRLVVKLALKYFNGIIPILDFIQEGNIALIEKAIEKFDVTKGYKFSTYATWWIRQGITRYIADKGDEIRLPVGLGKEISDIKKEIEKLEKAERTATIEELMNATKFSETKVKRILGAEKIRMGIPSLHQLISEESGDRSGERIDLVESQNPSPEDDAAKNELLGRIAEVLNTLSSREAKIIGLRFGIDDGVPKTLDEIGRTFQITRERVRQIEKKALMKLRHPKRSIRLKEFI